MIRAFLFLTLRTLLNRTKYKLRRLREPRYLLSILIAGAYFYFTVARHMFRRNLSLAPELYQIGGDVVALVVLALLILAWTIPNHAALEFSDAEIQFLFTAPVSRRQLLLYKLLRSQPAILTTAIVLTVIRMPNGHVIGVWVVWTAIAIYLTFVHLARARLQIAGVSSITITSIALAVFAACAWIVYAVALQPLASGRLAGNPFDQPITRALLLVPGVISRILFAREPAMLALYCAVVAAVAAALFFLSASLRVPFEELATSSSELQAAKRLRVRGRGEATAVTVRRVRPLFQLRSGAAPELAIVWKNLLAAMRISSPWAAFVLLGYGSCLTYALVTRSDEARLLIFGLSVFLVVYFPLIGAAVFVQDLRLDFRNFDILKSWPIAGERLLAAAMAAPLVLISALELIFVSGTFVLAQRLDKVPFFAQAEFVVIALLLAVPVCATQLVIRNSVPILFPAWAGKSKDEQRGFVAMGQKILSFIFNMVVLAVLLLPAAALSIGGYWLAKQLGGGGPAILALATMPAVAVLVAEVLFILRLLGARFDALDVATELSPG